MKNFNPKTFIRQENWDAKDIVDGEDIIHGYALNVSELSKEQRDALKAHLATMKITVDERKASVDTPHIKQGEDSFRVSEPNSIFQLAAYGWNWYAIDEQFEERNHTSVGLHTIVEKYSDFKKKKAVAKKQHLEYLNDHEIRNSVEEMIKNPDLKKRLMAFLVAEEIRYGQEQGKLKIDRPSICRTLEHLQKTKAPTQMRQMAQRELVKVHRKNFPQKEH